MVYLVKGISRSTNYYFETRKVKYINRKFVIYQGERYGNYIRHYIRSNLSISKWAVRLIGVSKRSSEIFEMSFDRGHRQDL